MCGRVLLLAGLQGALLQATVLWFRNMHSACGCDRSLSCGGTVIHLLRHAHQLPSPPPSPPPLPFHLAPPPPVPYSSACALQSRQQLARKTGPEQVCP